MDKIFAMEEALILLKNGIVLINAEHPNQIFCRAGNMISIYLPNAKIKLSVENFQKLYETSHFQIKSESNIEIDPEKDKEYYSWKQ